ncbi:YjfB family protein [Cytobacillus massiliigabonensis]|uniref:YjfB family protein n=1 Tax=Cytobacillus massiliigabonensis TaxID=1871011 RepID=UPI000C850179|nr:YjfB family protein [Cytobacillus massiliigabonensis]
MDIGILSMALSQGQVQQQASISVMKKVMDQAKGKADFIHQMMEGSNLQVLQRTMQPHLGGNIDLKG